MNRLMREQTVTKFKEPLGSVPKPPSRILRPVASVVVPARGDRRKSDAFAKFISDTQAAFTRDP